MVIAAFIDNVGDIGLNFLWLIAPTAGLFLLAAILNDELLVSHLLLRRRYLPYFLAAFAVAYLGAYASVWLEYWMRIALELPQRVEITPAAGY